MDAKWVFVTLGPLLLLMGAWRCAVAGRWEPQGRAWLLIGAIFVAAAWWLWR